MKSFLLSGPIWTSLGRREALIKRMAATLVENGESLLSDRDAVRVLLAKRYHTIDVAILAGEARQVAFQEIVGRVMSDG